MFIHCTIQKADKKYILRKNSKDNGNKSQCKIFIIPLNKVKWGIHIFTYKNLKQENIQIKYIQ